MREEIDAYTGRTRRYPETILERIAWALCAHDSSGEGNYLTDEELRGLEAMLGKMSKMCGNERAEAEYLGVPVATIETGVRKLKLLARLERSRRTDKDAMMGAHLTLAFWQDYMGEAEAAFSVLLESPKIAKAIKP